MRALRIATLLLLGAATAVAQEPQAPAPVSNPDVLRARRGARSRPRRRRHRFEGSARHRPDAATTSPSRSPASPSPIDYFSRVDQGTIHAPDLATASPDQVLTAYKRGEDAYIPRNFLIYVDLGFLQPGRPQQEPRGDPRPDHAHGAGRRRARRRLRPARRRSLADWTSSKEAIFSALARIEHEGVGMSRLRAEQQTVELIDSSPRAAAAARVQLADSYAQEVGAEIQTMLDEHEPGGRHADAPAGQEGVPVRDGRLRVPAGLRHDPVRDRRVRHHPGPQPPRRRAPTSTRWSRTPTPTRSPSTRSTPPD